MRGCYLSSRSCSPSRHLRPLRVTASCRSTSWTWGRAALNGNGKPTTDENDLALASVVRFGAFDAVIGGDLSGVASGTIDPDPGTPCSYTVTPTSYSPASGGGSTTINVSTAVNCAWSTSTNADTSGLGDG